MTDDSTLGQYRVNFRRWKTYCDAKTGGGYSVKATVVLNFFHEVMFCLMTKKKISPEAGYSGQVGRAPLTGTNPFKNAKGSTSKQLPQEEEEETDEGEERVTDQEEDGETYQEEEGEEEECELGSWKSMEQSPDSDLTEWEITHYLCDNDDDNTNGLNQLLGATLTNLLLKTLKLTTRHPAAGSKLAIALVFCISRGKTNRKGDNVYVEAIRHKNFIRCTVAAFAFLMLERFEKEKESIDFSNPNEWYNIKVLVASKNTRDSIKGKIKGKTTSDTTADDTQYIHFIPPGNNNLLSVQPQQQMSQVSRRPLADRGNLTVREAWDEFHGSMTLEKRHGVMGRAQKKAYSRQRYRGRTINSIRESILKEKSSEKGKMVDRGEKDDEVEE
ncbi:hypothetical protein BGZ46_007647 [Entomortierella lignicola]|nr:hypothetical protein BGZ46_007647 [Entomortierella lignicola]